LEFTIRPVQSFKSRAAGKREAGAAGSEQIKIPEWGDPRADETGGDASGFACALRF
jgi:hypothetical protein